MTNVTSRQPGLPGDRAPRDLGTSMIEVIVGLTLMAVFMTMFTAAIATMYRSANKTESLNLTTAQLNQVFDKLDGSVRYASAVSAPGQSGGAWYVELRTTNTGSPVCTQLRVNPAGTAPNSQQVQVRTWASPLAAGAPAPAWSTMAGSITNGGAAAGSTQPFTLLAPSATVPFQQLKVHLESSSGLGSSTTTSSSDVQLAAVNSSSDSLSAGVCTDVARS